MRCSILKRFFLVAFSLSFFLPLWGQELPSASPAALGMSADRLERLNSTMQRFVDDGRLAGVVTLILRKGSVAQYGSYGKLDVEAGTPMPKDAIFRIASQSKAVTSVAIMTLVEEGKLLLSEPVSKYLPEFKNPQVAIPNENGKPGYTTAPAKREITIRDLLTHTSGYSYGWGPAQKAYEWDHVLGWYFADHDEPLEMAIKRIAQLPLQSQPGEKYVYGFSTDILGRVVEVVSGQSLAEYFQEHIFNPLKMVDTHFFLPESKLNRFTPVYGIGKDGKIELIDKAAENDYVRGPRRCYSGGAGLLSTARDYARFLQMLLNGGELEGVRVLSRKTVELMTVNHVGDLHGNQGFGLGFWVTADVGKTGEHGTPGAFGWGGAYHTVYWVDPKEEMVAVLMCQLLPATNSDLHARFRSLVYQAIAD